VSDTTSESEKNSTGTQTDDNFNRELKSDTPQNRLALSSNDGEGIIEYAKEINENNENNSRTSVGNETGSGTQQSVDSTIGTTTGTTDSDATQNDKLNSVINDVEDYVEHRAGKIGIQTYSKMLTEYRASFLRIEKQMFKEMQELFMLVY
jgi:hypothetical protein